MWEEGEAFRKLNQKLKEIQVDKEEIEKMKKNRNKNKGLRAKGLPSVPTDGFSGNSRSTMGSTGGLIGMNETSEFDLEESEFNNIDKNEQKEIYQFK